jgi:hypothetical protein
MCRFSEFYENVHFGGRIFSREEFKIWYKAYNNRKIYTYNRDWDGFNIPGHILTRFRSEFLYKDEQKFLKLFKHLSNEQLDSIYVIGTADDSQKTTFKHELIHALYDTNKKYAREVNRLLKKNAFEPVYAWFNKVGYVHTVFRDELNAYITEDYRYIEKKAKLKKNTLQNLSIKLNGLYERYSPNIRKERFKSSSRVRGK